MNYIDKFHHIPSQLIQGENHACFLSIVVPTYRNAEGVKKVLDSVLGQDTEIDFNVIIVDNEATSEPNQTGTMLRSFADTKNVVYYKNQENLGMYGNWNRCFELSKSEYVLMLHADDYLLPSCLREVGFLLKTRRKITALYLNRYSVTDGAEPFSWGNKPTWKSRLKRRVGKTLHHVKAMDYLFGFCLTAPTGFVCRRDVFMASGGFNIRSGCYPGDTELALFLARGGKVWFYDIPLVVKREGNGNDGSNKAVTSALIPPHQTVYAVAFAESRILFKPFLLSMRLVSIMDGFNLEKKDIDILLDDKYFSQSYRKRYRLYGLIYYYFSFFWR